MKNTIKNTAIIMVAVALVFLSVGSALAESQSNGNSIYEDGLGKLMSMNGNSDERLIVAQSGSNQKTLGKSDLDKYINL